MYRFGLASRANWSIPLTLMSRLLLAVLFVACVRPTPPVSSPTEGPPQFPPDYNELAPQPQVEPVSEGGRWRRPR